MGKLEQPAPGPLCPCVGPLFMTEQLSFEQVGGDCCAVDRHEGALRSRAAAVDHLCDAFFPDSCLAEQQYRAIGSRDPLRRVQHGVHRGARSHEAGHRSATRPVYNDALCEPDLPTSRHESRKRRDENIQRDGRIDHSTGACRKRLRVNLRVLGPQKHDELWSVGVLSHRLHHRTERSHVIRIDDNQVRGPLGQPTQQISPSAASHNQRLRKGQSAERLLAQRLIIDAEGDSNEHGEARVYSSFGRPNSDSEGPVPKPIGSLNSESEARSRQPLDSRLARALLKPQAWKRPRTTPLPSVPLRVTWTPETSFYLGTTGRSNGCAGGCAATRHPSTTSSRRPASPCSEASGGPAGRPPSRPGCTRSRGPTAAGCCARTSAIGREPTGFICI